MKPPSWLRLRQTASTAEAVMFTVKVDATQFLEAVEDATRAIQRLGKAFTRTTAAAHPANQAIRQVITSRRRTLETAHARALSGQYVRGGLDPAFATPEARDAEVRRLCNRAHHRGPELAAWFLAGWAAHRPAACERVCEYAMDVLPVYAALPTDPARAALRREWCGNCEHYR